MSVYKMAINNVARTIKQNKENLEWNIFHAAAILASAFCKNQEDVLSDLLNHKEN